MKKDKLYLRQYEPGCVPVRPVEITNVFTMFLRCCRKPFIFAGELHEQWELVYVRSGEATFTVDDKVYRLGAGSLIFHRPMEFHQIHAEHTELEIFVTSFHMTGGEVRKFEQSIFELSSGEKTVMEELIRQCCALNEGYYTDGEFGDCRPFWQAKPLEFYACVHGLERLFCMLLQRSPTLQPPKETVDSLLYRNIAAVLEEHAYGDITIAQVADRCGVSPSTVKTCFHRHAGCGVHKYFLKIKVRTAIRLLETGQPVSQVSDALGFNNPNYFTYVFRRETGKRPTDFRP